MAPMDHEVKEDEEVKIEDEPSEEAELVKVAQDPGNPTKDQVAVHRITHVPFRTWCRWCVLGRGHGIQHMSRGAKTWIVPIVGLDYFFLTKGGVKARKELDMEDAEIQEARGKGDIVKCLIVRCYASKAVFAHVIPAKGVDEEGIIPELVVHDLQWLGHTRIIMKADNEPAIQALVTRALEQAKIELKDIDQLT